MSRVVRGHRSFAHQRTSAVKPRRARTSRHAVERHETRVGADQAIDHHRRVHVDVPDLVRQRARSNGAAGRRWLDRLPDVVRDLADRWELTVGGSFNGGTASYVTAVTDAAGRSRILKIAMPLDMDDADSFGRSVAAHRLAAGRGCVELIAVDADRSAMLLERVGPNLHEAGYSVPEVLDAVATTLLEFWRPVPVPDHGLRTGAEQATRLADFIVAAWDQVGRPCPRAVIDRALTYCDERAAAFDPATSVLVHGDAHGWNTLVVDDPTSRGRCKLVDPEGLLSDRAHDLAVPTREYNGPLLTGDTAPLTRARAEHLAVRCDVDPEAVWQWGFIERVSTGLANLRDFDNDDGAAFLTVAERCL